MSNVIPSIAYVAQANTAESDAHEYVMHKVEGCIAESGKKVFIHLAAQCPMDAISRASKLDSQYWM